jgi:hypothetical protein
MLTNANLRGPLRGILDGFAGRRHPRHHLLHHDHAIRKIAFRQLQEVARAGPDTAGRRWGRRPSFQAKCAALRSMSAAACLPRTPSLR